MNRLFRGLLALMLILCFAFIYINRIYIYTVFSSLQSGGASYNVVCDASGVGCITVVVGGGISYSSSITRTVYIGSHYGIFSLSDKKVEIDDGEEFYIDWVDPSHCDIFLNGPSLPTPSTISDGAVTVNFKIDIEKFHALSKDDRSHHF